MNATDEPRSEFEDDESLHVQRVGGTGRTTGIAVFIVALVLGALVIKPWSPVAAPVPAPVASPSPATTVAAARTARPTPAPSPEDTAGA